MKARCPRCAVEVAGLRGSPIVAIADDGRLPRAAWSHIVQVLQCGCWITPAQADAVEAAQVGVS